MKDYKLNLLRRRNKIYQEKKKRLLKKVYLILDENGYLMPDTDNEKTTIATNFEDITEAMNFFTSLENSHNLNIEYGDFTIINGKIFLTVNPK